MILLFLGLTVLRNALGPLFQYYFKLFYHRISHRLKKRKQKEESVEQLQVFGTNKTNDRPLGAQQSYQYDDDQFEDVPIRLAKGYTLKASRLLESIGKEVLTAYLTSLVLRQNSPYGAPTFVDNLLIYVVRPRAAPLTGILGLFEPWSQVGMADLIVDGFLSCVAGTLVGIRFWWLVGLPPSNPFAPRQDLKILAIGSILTAAPTYITLLITLMHSCVACDDDRSNRKNVFAGTLLGVLVMWALYLAAIALFIALLPFIAIWEMSAAVIHKIRHRKDTPVEQAAAVARRARLTQPLTWTSKRVVAIYRYFLFSSWCINVGNWIFWASYLKLEGELYCPTEIGVTEALWLLVPIGIDLFFWAFRVATDDASVNAYGSPQESHPLM
jgi:hypothetical protein